MVSSDLLLNFFLIENCYHFCEFLKNFGIRHCYDLVQFMKKFEKTDAIIVYDSVCVLELYHQLYQVMTVKGSKDFWKFAKMTAGFYENKIQKQIKRSINALI